MALKTTLRGLSAITVLGFTYALVSISSAPGRTQTRLIFFGILLILAYLGLAGLLLDVAGLAVVAGLLLLGIGFTQFVLFVYLLPTGAVLLVVGLALWVPSPVDTDEAPKKA
ncbi:hypothetical protein [Halorussus ruber]|uniref:hypothetical protein n=1 Tax=Halorussus ruber TaxID=1126238 RepID=UPI00109216B9|nr:hypothetical protein [Halorussus ruber]